MRSPWLICPLLVACAVQAEAATPVTYHFKGLVEYGSGAGHMPVGGHLGQYEIITIVLDSSVPGTLSGDTMSYVGGFACGNNQTTPILSVTLKGQTTNYGDGSCDTVTVTRNPSGLSSITMNSASFHIGTTFTASFVTSNPAVVPSYAIPAHIRTVDFDRSMFQVSVPSFDVSGDMSGT